MINRNGAAERPVMDREESLPSVYYCRVGRHGQIGRFREIHNQIRNRGDAVLVRTSRGVEAAVILSAANDDYSMRQLEPLGIEGGSNAADDFSQAPKTDRIDGKILRIQSSEDRLLIKQLNASAQSASFECQKYLAENNRSECLLDVEPMMDGKTLYFHFVGLPDDSLTVHLQSLAEIFQFEVQSSEFASLLEHGCGPGCGTSEKGGCGSEGGCAVCVVAKLRSGENHSACSTTATK